MDGEKKYLTIEELVKSLNDCGVETDSNTPKKLLFENYFKVVKGYKDVFLESDKSYKKGTHFNEIYALFEFDRDLRSLFLKRILMMENRLKSVLSNTFSKYGLKEYLIIENFMDIDEMQALRSGENSKNAESKIVSVTSMISKIHGTLSSQFSKRNQYITHYVQKYGRVPFWILVTILSFGEMSIFYSNMKKSDQNEVARIFNLYPTTLESFLRHLTLFRNVTAHDERFFSYRTHSKPIKTKNLDIYEKMHIEKNAGGEYIYGSTDIFSLLVIFKYLLEKDEFLALTRSLSNMIEELDANLKTVSSDVILAEMGFPKNWREITFFDKDDLI